MTKFDIKIHTFLPEDFDLTNNQKEKFNHFKCERVFRYGYIGFTDQVPNLIKIACKEAGYHLCILGGRRKSHTILGLKKIKTKEYNPIQDLLSFSMMSDNKSKSGIS